MDHSQSKLGGRGMHAVLGIFRFSRTGDPNHLIILISAGDRTKNVVYSEVL